MKTKTKKYNVRLGALDRAVIRQLGGNGRNTAHGCSIDEETAEELANVCRCGASCGFGGFIHYTETRKFTADNRAAIVARIREQVAEGLFDGANGVVSAVMSFQCLKDSDPAELEEEVSRVCFGPLKAIRDGEHDNVANALAWGALEDLAFRLDGAEMEG